MFDSHWSVWYCCCHATNIHFTPMLSSNAHYLLYWCTLPFITQCIYPCLWAVCLVRSTFETFLDMVNNQKDGTNRTKAKDCGNLVSQVLPPLWAPQTSQHTPAECIGSATGRLYLQYTYLRENEACKIAKNPLMKYAYLKFEQIFNQALQKTLSLICCPRERNAILSW